jgi:hypothetical protein
LLGIIYLRTTAARHRLLVGNRILSEASSFTPVAALATDNEAKNIVSSIWVQPSIYSNMLQGRNDMTALLWNSVCIAMTTDADLLEVAPGRDGLEPARAALDDVAKRSRSAGARRAILHAAQIFDILDSSRVRESNIIRPDLCFFVSALVLGLYLFSSDYHYAVAGPQTPASEPLQEIDWRMVNGEGLVYSPETGPYDPASDSRQMEWVEVSNSQILRVMSDFVIKKSVF